MQFISEIFDPQLVKYDQFNLLASGCGTGKSYFCANSLLEAFPDVAPDEVLFVTSRSITVDQQTNNENLGKYNRQDIELVRYWNKEVDDYREIADKGIQVMTYDKVIRILRNLNNPSNNTLDRIKIVVLDECHTMFSDTFINGIDLVKVWIHYETRIGQKLFLGLTATPGIVEDLHWGWGVNINYLNKEVLTNYKAKQISIAKNIYAFMSMMDSGEFPGKTIILCKRVADCELLADTLPNTTYLVSQRNPLYTSTMGEIREHIVAHEELPPTFKKKITRNGEEVYVEVPLKILATTSTMREGISLRESSGVRNIACCFHDELNICQYLGRARYDIDNLIIVGNQTGRPSQSWLSYFANQYTLFYEYIKEGNPEWFSHIAHLTNHSVEEIKHYDECRLLNLFKQYLDRKWVPPLGTQEYRPYCIYKPEDKQEMVDKAIDWHLFDTPKRNVTFKKVIEAIPELFGYHVYSNIKKFGGKPVTYKLITERPREEYDFPKRQGYFRNMKPEKCDSDRVPSEIILNKELIGGKHETREFVN